MRSVAVLLGRSIEKVPSANGNANLNGVEKKSEPSEPPTIPAVENNPGPPVA